MERPLAIWLQKSYLVLVNEDECVLFVDKSNYLLLNNFYYLSKIYGCAKKIYPNFKSLHLSNVPFLDYLKSEKIALYSIEVL